MSLYQISGRLPALCIPSLFPLPFFSISFPFLSPLPCPTPLPPLPVGYLAGFVVCLSLFSALMPFVMRCSSAALVNLSLLTSDFYGLLFGLFLFKYTVSWNEQEDHSLSLSLSLSLLLLCLMLCACYYLYWGLHFSSSLVKPFELYM